MKPVLWLAGITCGVMLSVIAGGLSLARIGAPRPVPTVAAPLMPGHRRPVDVTCTFYGLADAYRYCQAAGEVDLEVRDDVIQHTYVFTYSSGLEVGDVMRAWGTPTGADYYSYGAVEVYWADRSAYVLSWGPFSPFSRVGFVAYGPTQPSDAWQGYRTGR